MNTKRLMTIESISEEYGFSKATLRWWRHRGEGPKGFRVGRRVFFERADVESWLAELRNAA